MSQIFFSRKAEEDLESIADYIAQESPSRALAFVKQLRIHCEELTQFPQAYMHFAELGEDVRVMPHGNYVVLYRVRESTISIERILHSARDILKLMRDE